MRLSTGGVAVVEDTGVALATPPAVSQLAPPGMEQAQHQVDICDPISPLPAQLTLVMPEGEQAGAGAEPPQLVEADYELESTLLEIQDFLGSGAVGEVHLGLLNGERVAVKSFDSAGSKGKEAVAEFKVEVTVMQGLRHPNIVSMVGAVTRCSPMLLVLEYMPGGSLAARLTGLRSKGEHLDPQQAKAWVLQVARGAAYLHDQRPWQIIHRDLKPSNILIDADENLRIADFGLCKLVSPDPSTRQTEKYKMTRETGTYRYMAPEVFRGESYGCEVDVYSFGITAYEMLECLQPFGELSSRLVARRAGGAEALRPAWSERTLTEYSAVLLTLVERCWAHEPAKRPPFGEGIVPCLLKLEGDDGPIEPVGAEGNYGSLGPESGCCTLM